MLLSLQNLKTILSLAGINNLVVKFEPENKLIRAIFDHKDQSCQEIITFEQIETLFTDSREDAQAGAGQPIAGETVPSTAR